MKTYKNSFYKPEQHRNNPYIHEFITPRDETPIQYNGYEIYRYSSSQYDIVKDGVCLSMVGSVRYAKLHIDCGLDHVKTTTKFKELYPKN